MKAKHIKHAPIFEVLSAYSNHMMGTVLQTSFVISGITSLAWPILF